MYQWTERNLTPIAVIELSLMLAKIVQILIALPDLEAQEIRKLEPSFFKINSCKLKSQAK